MGTAAKPTRENRTIPIDFQSEATYFQLLGDGKACLECVLAFVMSLGFQLKHKATCCGGGCRTRHSPYARVRQAAFAWSSLRSPLTQPSGGKGWASSVMASQCIPLMASQRLPLLPL